METSHQTHTSHTHTHGPACGHSAIKHEGHVDYLHDGHMHHAHDGHIDECRVAVNTQNAASCTSGHACEGHESRHQHGASCGHPMIPHGDHQDYLVAGHLHHAHNGHCDHHGPLS